MREIAQIYWRVVENTNSLLLDIDNNICEQFNSIINKHIAGKRIHFALKSSYNSRVEAAVVSFNTSGKYIRAIHKEITNKSPGTFCYNYYYLSILNSIFKYHYYKNEWTKIKNFFTEIILKLLPI